MVDIVKKIEELTEKKQHVLTLPPKEAERYIVKSPEGAAIVHSLAEQDFYFLVNEIGAEDSLELLSMATDSQWEHIFDMEAWQKETVDTGAVIRWFELMQKVDAGRFIRWITSEKKDFLELFLYYHVEAGFREEDQDPSEFPDDFFTFDDLFYLRLVRLQNVANPADEEVSAYRNQVLYDFMKRVAEEDHPLFREILYYSAAVLPAEAEEELYRLRNVRLAEKGFLPFDEAIGIYQPVADLRHLAKKKKIAYVPGATMPVPLLQTAVLDETRPFSEALAHLDSAEVLRGLQMELAALCNRIAVADQAGIKGKQSLKPLVRKACGYIELGLGRLAGGDPQENPDPASAAAVLNNHFLVDIFRAGYSRAIAVKRRADSWYRESWFNRCQLPVSFWGEEYQAILSGLLVKRPLFFDPEKPEGYRDFESPADLQKAADALDHVMALDRLLNQAGFDPSPVSFDILTYKNLLLTRWARDCLGLPPVVDFIEINDFRPFFADLMTAPSGEAKTAVTAFGKIADYWRELFLDWLAVVTGISSYEISQAAGRVLEDLFAEIEDSLGRVSPPELSPRYVDLFLVS